MCKSQFKYFDEILQVRSPQSSGAKRFLRLQPKLQMANVNKCPLFSTQVFEFHKFYLILMLEKNIPQLAISKNEMNIISKLLLRRLQIVDSDEG